MKKFILLFCLASISTSLFATDRTEVGNAIGKILLGDQYKEGESIETTLNGLDNCQIDLRIDVSLDEDGKAKVQNFTIEGHKDGKSILIQPFKLQSLSVDSSKVVFSSMGPCTGGLLWGASCDKDTNSISVKKNREGNITSIELKNTVDLLIDKTESLKCRF